MGDGDEIRVQVDQFVIHEIDSVSHLEALLLLWSGKHKQWSPEEMAKALYVKPAVAERILRDLAQRSLAISVENSKDQYSYDASSDERNTLIRALDEIYRREVVRISNMIHAKGSAAMREFAKAFVLKKDRES
jgi:hypothetical protein